MWSAGTIILQFVFGLRRAHDIDALSGTEWFEEWSTMLPDRINGLNENKGPSHRTLFKHTATKKPDNELSADPILAASSTDAEMV